MSEAFRWWLVLEVIGIFLAPLCLAVFRRLPDRGYTLTKPFGLILLGYTFWLLNTRNFLPLLPNSSGGIIAALLLLIVVSGLFAYREREGLVEWARRDWRYIVAVEVLFLVVFAVAVWLRSMVGQIAGTEQPMDLMFVNAATHAEHFPPKDPWLSGHTVAYYYFGYLLVAMVSRLADVPTEIGYNIGLAMIAAMALAGASGLVYNLVQMREAVVQPEGGAPRQRTRRRAVSRRVAVVEQPASLYTVLGVERDATEKRIRGAYRYLSKKYEAAAGSGDKRAQAQLKEAANAFEILSDAKHREEYDRSLDGASESHDAPDAVIPEPVVDVTPAQSRFNWRPPAFGIAGGLMLVVMGNLVWVLQFASAYGIGGRSFYDWIGVSGLGPKCGTPKVDPCTLRHAWYPAQFFGFFNASRIYPLNNADFRAITEFPMFSFVLGDLHPHVMALPFVLLVVAAALSLYRSPEPLDITFWLQRPLLLVALAIMLGGLAFINTWDIATMAFVVVAAAFVSNFTRVRGVTADLFVQIATFALPLVVLAIVLYLPFYLSFSSQADGIGAVVTNKGITVAATRPLHLFLFWGPLFAVVIPFVVARILPARERITRTMAAVCAAPAALIVAGWALLFLFEKAADSKNLGDNPGNVVQQITDRGTGWITAIFVAAVLAGALLALWLELTSDDDGADRATVLFPLTITATALLLVLGTEFFFVGDVFRSRMNTVFKLYYQAWLLLAIAGGFSLYYLATNWRFSFPRERQYRIAWGAAAALALAGAALYPLGGTFNRIKPYDAQDKAIDTGGNLDGLTHMSADERSAIAFLNKLAQGQDLVIAEGVGNDYSDASRISAATGIPTILGWGGHEDQWRGGTAQARAGRFEDVDTLYKTTDVNQMNEILKKYGVTYIYVGDFERNKYGTAGMAKFQSLPSTPFGTVTIYRASAVTGEVATP